MRFIPTISTFVAALLTIGITHADPILYLKNKSNRTIHVQPFIGDQTFEAQQIRSNDDALYTAEELGNNMKIDGIRVKYCMSSDPNYTQCNIAPDVLSASGKAYEFKFSKKARDAAKKYYLKLTIEDDQASLEPQKGILGRTENRKWSLSGNIKGGDENIKGPTPYYAAQEGTVVPPSSAPTAGMQKPKFIAPPTDMPPALPVKKAPERPTIPAPTEEEDIAMKPKLKSPQEVENAAWAEFPEANRLRMQKNLSLKNYLTRDNLELARLVFDITGPITKENFATTVSPKFDSLVNKYDEKYKNDPEIQGHINRILKSSRVILQDLFVLGYPVN